MGIYYFIISLRLSKELVLTYNIKCVRYLTDVTTTAYYHEFDYR